MAPSLSERARWQLSMLEPRQQDHARSLVQQSLGVNHAGLVHTISTTSGVAKKSAQSKLSQKYPGTLVDVLTKRYPWIRLAPVPDEVPAMQRGNKVGVLHPESNPRRQALRIEALQLFQEERRDAAFAGLSPYVEFPPVDPFDFDTSVAVLLNDLEEHAKSVYADDNQTYYAPPDQQTDFNIVQGLPLNPEGYFPPAATDASHGYGPNPAGFGSPLANASSMLPSGHGAVAMGSALSTFYSAPVPSFYGLQPQRGGGQPQTGYGDAAYSGAAMSQYHRPPLSGLAELQTQSDQMQTQYTHEPPVSLAASHAGPSQSPDQPTEAECATDEEVQAYMQELMGGELMKQAPQDGSDEWAG